MNLSKLIDHLYFLICLYFSPHISPSHHGKLVNFVFVKMRHKPTLKIYIKLGIVSVHMKLTSSVKIARSQLRGHSLGLVNVSLDN